MFVMLLFINKNVNVLDVCVVLVDKIDVEFCYDVYVLK